jgi:hypothetical protein
MHAAFNAAQGNPSRAPEGADCIGNYSKSDVKCSAGAAPLSKQNVSWKLRVARAAEFSLLFQHHVCALAGSARAFLPWGGIFISLGI